MSCGEPGSSISPIIPLPSIAKSLFGAMEGDRSWAFTAPAFAHVQGSAPRPAAAVYCPTGWRKRRRRGGGQGSDKRHKGAAAPPAAPLPAAQPGAAPRRAAAPPPNPAQLVPLRCAWPHPAVLDLLAQQCWPAAGAAALMRPAAKQHPQLGPQPNWWNYMLPSLSLLHPPLAAERQELLETSSGGVGSGVEVMWLPQPNVLVGYEVRKRGRSMSSWLLCIPASV